MEKKILDGGLKWRNQGAGWKDCQEGTNKLGEGGGWRLGQALSHATHASACGGCRR